MLDLDNLAPHDASLLQRGLASAGFYKGTYKGLPGALTRKAYRAYLDSLENGIQRKSEGSLKDAIVRLALSEVGIREIPRNSNRGERIEEYQAATWLEGSGWPWCAAFVCWLCREAGMSNALRPTTPGAWDFENWARKTPEAATLIKPIRGTKIEPGDILVFTFSHIGLAVGSGRWGKVSTVEGNTDPSGSREGGGVYKRSRKRSEVRSIIRLK